MSVNGTDPRRYPGMARVAREEGFDEIADWFETLERANTIKRRIRDNEILDRAERERSDPSLPPSPQGEER